MTINFTSLKFKNFLSYGNDFTEYQFQNGIDIITGSNGSGKSSLISEPLFFALFGKPFRKINLPNLINFNSKKNLVVHLNFSINNNIFTIKRGLSPNFFKIYKNNSLIPQPATLKQYQSFLEENILHCNETIFRQLIILDNNISFMNLSKSEKSQLFETLTNSSIFNQLLSSLKSKLSSSKSDLSLLQSNINNLKSLIKSETKLIKEAEIRNNQFNSINDKSINNLHSQIKDLQSFINSNNPKPLINLNIIKSNIKKYQSSLHSLNIDINNSKSKLLSINSALKNSITCNNCGHHIIPSHININDKPLLQSNLTKLNTKLKNIQSKINSLNSDLSNSIELNNNIKSFNNDLLSKQKSLNDLQSKLNNLLNIKPLTIDYSNLNSNKSKLKQLNSQLKLKQSHINNINYLINLLSTDNLKGIYLRHQLPFLNSLVNQFLSLFNLSNFKFHINEHFSETIFPNFNNKSPLSFNQLSNGQKLRLSFSIMFAFLKLIESRNGVQTNILLLDEILDSSVDEQGRLDLLHILLSHFSSSKNIIIISHNNDIKHNFENFNRTFLILNNKKTIS